MAETLDIAALKAAGMSDADIASLAAFDLGTYQKNFQANTGAYEGAKAAGLTAAQATGLSDRYVAYNDPAYGDIVPGTNAQVLGNLGMMPSVIEYTPVFNIKGDQGYEDYDFAPIPGATYRLLDNNTGKVIATATNATEAKGLAQAANAISDQMGGNANWAIQQQGSFSDGKGNMTTGFSDVYTNEKTGTMNDLKGLIQAAGIMAAVGGGIAALSTSAAGGAGAGAASAAGAAEAGSLAPGALASTASNVAAINTAAQATAASAGLSSASANLLSQVGMGAVRGGITSAALGQDPIKGAITGGFGALGRQRLGQLFSRSRALAKLQPTSGLHLALGLGQQSAALPLETASKTHSFLGRQRGWLSSPPQRSATRLLTQGLGLHLRREVSFRIKSLKFKMLWTIQHPLVARVWTLPNRRSTQSLSTLRKSTDQRLVIGLQSRLPPLLPA